MFIDMLRGYQPASLWDAAVENYLYNVIVLVSAVVFFVTYLASDSICQALLGQCYTGLSTKSKVDRKSRTPAVIHAALVSVLSTYALIAEDQLRDDLVWGDSVIANASCAIVTGFMLSDFIVMVWHYKHIGEIGFIFHHLATMFAYLTVTHYHVFEYCAMWRLIAEYSTPFLHIRVFLDDLHLRSSKLYFVNGLLFVLMFVGARILTMPYHYYLVYSMHGTDSFAAAGDFRYVLYVSCLVLDTLNCYWATKVVRGFFKTLRAMQAGSGKRIEESDCNGNGHSVLSMEAGSEAVTSTARPSKVHENSSGKKAD